MKDEKIKVLKNTKFKNTFFNENGFLIISDQIRYGSLDSLVEKFDIDKKMIETLLYPYQESPMTLYVKKGDKVTAYHKLSEVREVLNRHGLAKSYVNRKRSGPWKIKTGGKTKFIKGNDLTMEIEGEFYARPAYWEKNIGIKKGILSKLRKVYKNEFILEGSVDFNPQTSKVLEKYRVIKEQKIQYLNANTMNKLISLTKANILEKSKELPENADLNLYNTNYIWREKFFEEKFCKGSSRSTIMSYSVNFFNKIETKPSYIDEFKDVKFRVYHEKDAQKAHNETIDKAFSPGVISCP